MALDPNYLNLAVATDVVFTVKDQKLQICLIERNDDEQQTACQSMGFAGRPYQREETLDECAKRGLEQKTGIKAQAIQQFMNFSAWDRDPRQRTISVAYIAIQSSEKLNIKAGTDTKKFYGLKLKNS